MSIRLSLEALVAGVDLDGLTDTDQSPKSDQYDELRKLEPNALKSRLNESWPGIVRSFNLKSGSQRLKLNLTSAEIAEVGNVALPRESMIHLEADLPQGSEPVTFGWDKANGPLIVRQMGVGDEAYTGYLTKGQTSAPMPRSGVASQSGLAVFGNYIVIGFEHIIPKGLDHILFVLGLFFFSAQWRPLLIQVTAFTAAHTVTLALASLGVVNLPASIVEPLIAASIVYVALENIRGGKIGWWRTAVVFAFGLLHGLGFASVLGDVGLDPARFALGLIGFNIGVELGQLAVIAVAFLLVGWAFRNKDWYRARIAIPCSIAIALVGAYWVVERVLF